VNSIDGDAAPLTITMNQLSRIGLNVNSVSGPGHCAAECYGFGPPPPKGTKAPTAVTIGAGSKIMAGAVVTESVPPDSVVTSPRPEVRPRQRRSQAAVDDTPEDR